MRNPFRLFVLSSALAFVGAGTGLGQTTNTVFSDTFTSSTGATYDQSGAIGSSANWWLTRVGTGNDFGARINGGILDLSNDGSATVNAAGYVFAYIDTSTSASSPWTPALSSNSGLVSWEFNMRQIRTDPSGFASGSYGVAFILASTSSDSSNVGAGYAVLLGGGGATSAIDPIRLVRFSSGLSGTLTTLVTSSSAGLTDFGNEYLSVRVTYNPANNTWELFLRNDGTSGFADPTTGSLISQGTAVDSVWTSTTNARYTGGFWSGSTTANQTAFFDNVYLKITTATPPATQAAALLPQTSTPPGRRLVGRVVMGRAGCWWLREPVEL